MLEALMAAESLRVVFEIGGENFVDLSEARDDGGRQEALERARRAVLAHSAAHRVLHAALQQEPCGPG